MMERVAAAMTKSFLVLALTLGLSYHCAWSAEKIDYARDIRPILSANCFQCHGADDKTREADLRLDDRAAATAKRKSGAAITPGKLQESALIARITSSAADQVMPPRDSGKSLKPHQIELLQHWVEQGAEYTDHWAFVAPVRPAVPKTAGSTWGANAIDAFILARLRQEKLEPSPAAGPYGWFRRVHLDLTGLPPEPNAIQQFVEQWSAAKDHAGRNAVKHACIDELLKSPHYGEKWGRQWLDAARYADSDGFEKDKPRNVWFYRDYVINAFNEDKPYNEFLIEQLAGDLLPNATQDQIVATGFLRNSMINEEGGVDPEQFRMEAMFDRMDAIGKAMFGLTIQCCQCHTHKYDPLTQTDYYRMFAMLNNCHEGSVTVYTRAEQQQRAQLLAEINQIEADLKTAHPDWPTQVDTWLDSLQQSAINWTIVKPTLDTSGGQKHYVLADGSILAQGYAPTKHTTEFTVETSLTKLTGLRLELLNDPDLPHLGPGRAPDGLCALTEFRATVTRLGEAGKPVDVKFGTVTADANPAEQELHSRYDDKGKKRRVTGPVSYANDGNNDTAWGIDVGGGRSNVPRNAVFALEQPLENPAGFRVTFKLVQMHGGWNSDDNQNNNLGRFRLSVTDAQAPVADVNYGRVREIAAKPAGQRSDADKIAAFSAWRLTKESFAQANDKIETLWRQHPKGTSQLVALERKEPRETHRLDRGDFLKPQERVSPGVPEWMHALSASAATPSRLDFARWLADRRSPTVARSIVNRLWQSYFGTGLVETSEDLGTQGSLPSHPELLDWLALELVENNWSLKHIHRLICSSDVYGQSSAVNSRLLAVDPYNRLLARGPRARLDAELVRDVALAACGLLQRDVGGPSVYPPAPDFLFAPPASYGPKIWGNDTGPAKYRRGMYTFRFRSVPYPMLQTFDSPNGDFACVRRPRSNTPLQALTTLNEPLFVECAQALATKTLREGGATDADRLQFAFLRCVSRPGDDRELAVLTQLLQAQRQAFASDTNPPKLAPRGELPAGVTPSEAAAWVAVARVLLNLDETISKE